MSRRLALRSAVAAVGAAAATPLLGNWAAAAADLGEVADALFKAGMFEQAARAYEDILAEHPGNAHAATRRGFIALLSNRFAEAERFLTRALALAPSDKQIHRLLADCHTRQDEFALAAPHWRAAEVKSYAELFAAFRGRPYELHGDSAELPFTQLDPVPVVEGSLNGGPRKRFTFYTRVAALGLSPQAAEEAGLRAVVAEQISYVGRPVWQYHGVLDSFRLGGIELRNLPVRWTDTPGRAEDPDGMIGTWIFQHLLTTAAYADRKLILRRRTPEAAAQVRAEAERAGVQPLPLWLAREHLIYSRGSIAGSGPRVMGLNLGGTGEMATGMPLESARQLGIRIDEDRPIQTVAGGQRITVNPCYPNEVRLGGAVARNLYCYANENFPATEHGFDVLGHFAHSFFKPHNATLDFTDMKLYVTRSGHPRS